MTTIIETTYHAYSFHAAFRLSQEQMTALVRHLSIPRQPAEKVLGGRSQLKCLDLPGFGPVVVKPYLRGGLIRHLNRRTHFRWGISRPQAEFDRLIHVRKIGVNAPEPVVVITRGRRFYHGWLVIRFIDGCRSLAEMCQTDPPSAKSVIGELQKQVTVLMDHHILHTDLHPGNVLIGPAATVYIIDFDKARTDIHNHEKLRTFYQERWHRAIIKYRLPSWLDEAMAEIGNGDRSK